MKSHLLLTVSHRVYSSLVRLYPAAYRAQYAGAMKQLFADQCREAQAQRGVWGLLGVWLRTAPDFLFTVISEHGHAADLRAELINPDPSRRMPWKTLALVLAPGLVVCAGQVLSLTGSTWYFDVYRYLGFYLLIPAVIGWVWTRKFPVWGLIPLGMAINFLVSYNWYWRLVNLLPIGTASSLHFYASMVEILHDRGVYISDSSMASYWEWVGLLTNLFYLLEQAGLAAIGWFFIRRWWKEAAPSRPFRDLSMAAAGVMAALVLGSIGFALYDLQSAYTSCAISPLCEVSMWLSSLQYLLTEPVRQLFLLGLCAVFARRYGSWSVLLMLGYLLPAVLFGFTETWEWDVLLTLAILGWRFGIAVIAPFFVLRSVSARVRKLAILAPLGIVLVFRQALSVPFQYPGWDAWTILNVGTNALVTLGVPFVFLALAMELTCVPRPVPPVEPAPAMKATPAY